MSKPAKRAARCPKCRSRELRIVEQSLAYTTFEQDADGRIDPEGHHSPGSITGIRCICAKCEHRWRPREAIQVTCLSGYPEIGAVDGPYTR